MRENPSPPSELLLSLWPPAGRRTGRVPVALGMVDSAASSQAPAVVAVAAAAAAAETSLAIAMPPPGAAAAAAALLLSLLLLPLLLLLTPLLLLLLLLLLLRLRSSMRGSGLRGFLLLLPCHGSRLLLLLLLRFCLPLLLFLPMFCGCLGHPPQQPASLFSLLELRNIGVLDKIVRQLSLHQRSLIVHVSSLPPIVFQNHLRLEDLRHTLLALHLPRGIVHGIVVVLASNSEMKYCFNFFGLSSVSVHSSL